MTTRAWRGATGCTFTTRGFKNSVTDPCIAAHFAGSGAGPKTNQFKTITV
jgi:hypothetical protein